jgi:hypothetical protein
MTDGKWLVKLAEVLRRGKPQRKEKDKILANLIDLPG